MRKVVALIWLVVMWPLLSQNVPAARVVGKQVRGEVASARGYLNEAKRDLQVRNLGGIDLNQAP